MIESEVLLVIRKTRVFWANVSAGLILLFALLFANFASGDLAYYGQLAITFSIGLIWGRLILDPKELSE